MKQIHRAIIKLTIILLTICILLISLSQDALAHKETKDLKESIDQYIKQEGEKNNAVAIVVVQNDEPIVNKTFGYADIEQGYKTDENTVFEWASCSKILIWISVMQLVEEGLIDLDKDIAEYLPQDFNYPTSYEKPITMMHLMNHTAGFDDSYTDLVVYNPPLILTLRQVLEQADIIQQFSPGDIVAYSNYGAALAAYIVEVVSGIDYRDYVQNNILNPLEMNHTSIDPKLNDNLWVRSQRKKIQGYTEDGSLISPNSFVIPIYPAGSVVGTSTDFAKLLTVLLSKDGKPLFKNEHTINLMFQPTMYFPKSNIPRLAHGLMYLPSQGKVYGHGGNSLAFSSSLYLDREKKLGVVVMTNQFGENYYCLGIPELVFGKPESTISEENLEDSNLWKGIYQPARMPYHGFSKLFGLLNRTTVKPQDNFNLVTNNTVFVQQKPGIYLTQDEFSLYSLDVYSNHNTYGKILSSTNTDLIQIPLWQHVCELSLLVLAIASALFSFSYLLTVLIRRISTIRKEKSNLNSYILVQNFSNLIIVINVVWLGIKAFSMSSYTSLKIHFQANMIYMFVTVILAVYNLFKNKDFQLSKNQNVVLFMTVLSSFLIWTNLCYWEFFH